jgi:hypothetical protein
MFDSRIHRGLWLTLAAAALFSATGCTNQATNEPVTTAKKAAPAKPAAAKPATAAVKPVAAKAAPVSKAPQPTATVTVPKGTEITATVGQTLATDKNKVGDTFAGSLASPITVEGKTVIPKGAKVTGRIVKIKKNELKVTLASVVVRGKSYDLETNSVAGSKNQPKNNAKDAEKAKANNDVTVLATHSQMKFKLAKPVTIPVKG